MFYKHLEFVDTILMTVILLQSTCLPSTVTDTEEKASLASSLKPHPHSEKQHVQLPEDHQDGVYNRYVNVLINSFYAHTLKYRALNDMWLAYVCNTMNVNTSRMEQFVTLRFYLAGS